jgi:dTMP kinase
MKIREIASAGREGVTLEEELSYFINDRAEDAEKNIIPALDSGQVVVMDRYIHSNMAYQTALGLDINLIVEKNSSFPQPDRVFFLDIEPAEGLKRVDGRGGGANVGYEKIEFLEKVYGVFNQPEFDSMERVDATGTVEGIAEIIGKKVDAVL